MTTVKQILRIFFFVIAICILLYAMIAALAIFGLAIGLILGILSWASAGFRTWLLGQPGYRNRVAQIPGFSGDSPVLLGVALLVSLVPLSIVCWLFLRSFVGTPLVFIVTFVMGVGGVVLAYLWLLRGWRLADLEEEIAAPTFSAKESAAYLKTHKALGAGLGMILLVPFFCCMSIFASSIGPISTATPVSEVVLEDVAAESEVDEMPTAVEVDPTATQTSKPTSSPTSVPEEPTQTPSPEPTDTAVPTATAEPEVSTSLVLDSGEEITGNLAAVTEIIDGDTIEVEIGGEVYRVRYIGMDTPERSDPYFAEASEANRLMVEGQTVILVKDVSETDRYGRLLRYVYLQDGTFVNAEMVKSGFALAATYPPDVAHEADFIALQQEARNARRGLWEDVAVVVENPAPANTAAPVPAATNPPEAQPTNAAVPQPTDTAVPAPPTNTPEPVAAPGKVVISSIYYDGQEPRSEGDEFAVITNQGGSPVNMGGWRLNAGEDNQNFGFPGFDLLPGQSCRVYTNQVHGDSCGGGSFNSGRALWNNDGDCGRLFDASGAEVSNYCY